MSWCNVYKVLLAFLLLLIAVEYFFGTIEYKKWPDSMFATTHYHSGETNDTFIYGRKQFHVNGTTTISSETLPMAAAIEVAGSAAVTSAENTTTSDWTSDWGDLPLCPDSPPNLRSVIKVLKSTPPSVTTLEKRFSWLEMGGKGRPVDCHQARRVAIIVPFRCRAEHLLLFLQHMHPFLRDQQVDYALFVVEQERGGLFNRAALMNVGYVEALKMHERFDCFIFHDVDLLPEDERNLYQCPDMPRHMSVAVDVFDYSLPYREIFGGVSAITTEHFRLLNGFSNSFWGWGGEDDDMSNRIRYHGLYISRYPKTIARYTMLTHKKEKANPDRYEALKNGKLKYDSDGLSNLQYKLLQMKRTKLYTWFLVHIGPSEGR